MDKKDQLLVLKVAEEIASYILNHPNAADSIEGISSWWLMQQRYQTTLTIVQEALDLLVNSGRLLKSTTLDGKEVYSLAQKKHY